jgi:hypothetical protein
MNKKNLFLLFCIPLILFFTQDETNINLNVSRVEDASIEISWEILFEDYDSIVLNLISDESNEQYELPFNKGSIVICCYDNEVTVQIVVVVTSAEKIEDESCDALECFNFKKIEYVNEANIGKIKSPQTTTTTTVPNTTTTTIATIPKNNNLLNVEITNPLITSIPMYEEVDFTDIEKNNIASVIVTGIIFLFYLVLLLQEWFNKIISTYNINFLFKDKEFKQGNKIITSFYISISLLLTSFLLGYVEEGAELSLDLENLAIFVAAFFGLATVTFLYEGTEAIIEKQVYKQSVRLKWAPQAIFFALLSTVSFIFFEMPIGFIFGFIATSQIISERKTARLSPKFYSSVFLICSGYFFFYLTSLEVINSSSLFTAATALTYLMCLEGVMFKSLPGGGNELSESFKDSKGFLKILPIVSFIVGFWLFVRILIVKPDSEFDKLQQELMAMGSFAFTFASILIIYILILLILGVVLKYYARKRNLKYEY